MPFPDPVSRTNPVRKARRGAWHASRMEKLNAAAIDDDVYEPLDSESEDLSVHSADLSEETDISLGSETGTAGAPEMNSDSASSGEPEEDVLAPLPEQQASLQAAAQVGDLAAAAELAEFRRLQQEGKLTSYGTSAESASDSESYQEDSCFDLTVEGMVEEATSQFLTMGEEGKAELGESSQAAEARRPAAGPVFRRLNLEPPDDMGPEEELQMRLQLWPTLDQYIPVEEWHPYRLVFDDKDHLVLPPGPAHTMYGFLTGARYGVRQYGLNDPEVQPFITMPAPGQGGPRGQRPDLDLQRLNQVFHLWDPRIQNLLSQVKSTPDAEAISTRKRHWRETLRYRRKEVSLAQLHDRAATVGITPGHSQRPANSDFEWPDPVPARIETNLPALEGPPVKQKRKMIVESPESEEAEEELVADQPPDLLVEEIPADSSLIPMQPARSAALKIMGPQDPFPPAAQDLHELRQRCKMLSEQCARGEESLNKLAEEKAARDLSYDLLHQRYQRLLEVYTKGKEEVREAVTEMRARITLHRVLERDLAQLGQRYAALQDSFIALNGRYQAVRQRHGHDPDYSLAINLDSDEG